MITKGSRVATLFGNGTVIGYEVRGRQGKSLPPSETPEGLYSRVLVKLDNPENWIMHEPGIYPHLPRDSIHLLEDQSCTPSEAVSTESLAKSG